jgi:hypothetical protein
MKHACETIDQPNEWKKIVNRQVNLDQDHHSTKDNHESFDKGISN